MARTETPEQAERRRERLRARYRNDPEYREKSKQRANRNYCPVKRRERLLREAYGLTPEQYDEMRKAQHGRCLICSAHEDDLPRGLVVDHCHSTGKVRGLLCDHCNHAIGKFNDDPELIRKAIAFLEAHNADEG